MQITIKKALISSKYCDKGFLIFFSEPSKKVKNQYSSYKFSEKYLLMKFRH